VVEGSATALMSVWMRRALREGNVDPKAMIDMQKSEMERAKPLLDAPRYFSLIAANYMVGVAFVTRGKSMTQLMTAAEEDSGAAIREAAKHPPRSTEQLLHPEKYWDEGKRDEPVRVANDDDLVQRLERDTGRQVLHRDTLGEMICAIVAAERGLKAELMGNPGYWTNKFAKGWGGDRLYLLGARGARGKEDLSAPGVVWVTAWDTADDREEFVEGVRGARGAQPGFGVAEDGKVAVFAFGKGGKLDAGLREILAAARFTKDGAVWQR
jgi:hypothetical protein